MDFVAEILSVVREIRASTAEKEVERLMAVVLRGTVFANKAHAVGGYVVIISLYSAHSWR